MRLIKKENKADYIVLGYQGAQLRRLEAKEKEGRERREKTDAVIREAEKRTGMTGLGAMQVDELGLTKRVSNALKRQGVTDFHALADLIVNDWKGFLRLKTIGDGSRKEIMEKLKEYGIGETEKSDV